MFFSSKSVAELTVVTARNEVGFCISVQKVGMREGKKQKLHLSLELCGGGN